MTSVAEPPRERSAAFVTATTVACLVIAVAIYLSTGTMAPYAVTAQYPAVLEPCHYLVNVDHWHFAAVSRMLAAADPGEWAWSVVLRRLLFPAIAHPFVTIAGFLPGGVAASILLHVVVLAGFSEFVRRESGEHAAITAAFLLATYPGVTYWGGLPYSYVTIIPGSLVCMMLLYRIHRAATFRDVMSAALMMGVAFLGYDLYPFFVPAALILLALRRQVAWAMLFVITAFLPLVLVALTFVAIDVPVLNQNTATYLVVALSYLQMGRDVSGWIHYLQQLPEVLLTNYLFGNLIFLPLLFVVALFAGRRFRIRVLERPDVALLLAALAIFLFNNAAPPYFGWQMRGSWIARFYQPIFPVLLFAAARATAGAIRQRARWWYATVVLAVLLNASIAFGPALMNPLAAYAYHKFYVHSPPESMLINLERFGRRPLGFCRASHEWENIRNPNTSRNRPAFMYRYR